jgi:hypothetical protein
MRQALRMTTILTSPSFTVRAPRKYRWYRRRIRRCRAEYISAEDDVVTHSDFDILLPNGLDLESFDTISPPMAYGKESHRRLRPVIAKDPQFGGLQGAKQYGDISDLDTRSFGHLGVEGIVNNAAILSNSIHNIPLVDKPSIYNMRYGH